MCWEREEPKKASEEIDEILKKIVKEAEKEETEIPAKMGWPRSLLYDHSLTAKSRG